ncbi:antibiotic biosynthesis monooxygenase [Rhizobium sp. L1K21]|uniref:antibiotic biosynthesis monooxygenase family protein n=1 Tax=Rhizobium sp. L1K21 TaxID=2954933 RepID=UPI002093794A|nr:antibiotic biosynthesis monooxygenase [Rhizobium sp. L1K21]MCO6186815.1 antibiotic biosynthesis monooxygenase [Rhizobium sp. L1K21]
MIAVIFEVEPAEGMKDIYLQMAAELVEYLKQVDGFISIERFQSLTSGGKLLSLSFWRDEEAVSAWRNEMHHREAQMAGRKSVFSGYRLRVAHVMRDYGLHERTQAPSDALLI